MDDDTFPFVEVRGGPWERGRQHGEACRAQVRQYADTLLRVLTGEAALRSLNAAPGGKSARPTAEGCGERAEGAIREAKEARLALTRDDLYARAMTFLPFFEAYCPHLVEEIRGIAEGADVPFAAALLVNVRAEVAGVRITERLGSNGGSRVPEQASDSNPEPRNSDGCTSFAVGREAAGGGATYLGQNQDQDPAMEELGIVLRVRPDHGPPMVMATFGGLVGYPGLNAAGVAFFQNALSSGVWRHAMPHYPLKRVLLEQPDVDGCLAAIGRARLASSGNYALGDGSGRVVDVEATPDGYAVVEPEDGIVVHTNHFRSVRFAPHERLLGSLPDSAPRLDQITSLLQRDRGRITLDTVKAALRDHTLGAAGICRHEPGRPMKTIASIIAEPDKGLLHVARGNPCENEFVAYSVE